MKPVGLQTGLGMSIFIMISLSTVVFQMPAWAEENATDKEELFDEYLSLFDTAEESEGAALERAAAGNSDGVLPENLEYNSAFRMSIDGTHDFVYRLPLIHDSAGEPGYNYHGAIKRPRFENTLGLEIEKADRAGALKLVFDWAVNAVISESGEYSGDTVEILPLENALYYSADQFKLGFGWQYYSWGAADQQNPTDNLNPRDYSVGPEAKKIPLFSTSVHYYPSESGSVEAVYAPFEQDDIFLIDARENIPAAFFNEQVVTGLDLGAMSPTAITVKENEKIINIKDLDYAPQSCIAGFKINRYTADYDMSISYLYDYDQFFTPEITLKKYQLIDENYLSTLPVSEQVKEALRAQYVYRVDRFELRRLRAHRIGADLKGTIGEYGAWLEACYTITEDPNGDSYKRRNPNLSWTMGLDNYYGPHESYYINMQYIGRYIFDYDQDFFSDYHDGLPDSTKIGDEEYMKEYYYRALTQRMGGETEGLLQGVSMGMEWPITNSVFTPKLKIVFLKPFLYDKEERTRLGSLYLNPEIDIMPKDAFHIFLGADLCYSWYREKGESGTQIDTNDRIGQYYRDNSIYLTVEYKWGYETGK